MDITSKRFKELRETAEIKQGNLAEVLGISQSMISNYENGREPPIEVLLAYREYFDVSVDYLLGATEEKKPPTSDIAQRIAMASKAAFAQGAAHAVSGEDVLCLFEKMRAYYKAGAPSDNLPMEVLYNFVEGFTTVLDACAKRDTMNLLDSVNATSIAVLDVTKILTKYMENSIENDG